MNNKTCYIFAAGDYEGFFSAQKSDLTIAADAGYHLAKRLGIQPDILLGDFDTIGVVPTHPEIIKFNPEKDYTDTELAIIEGIKRGYGDFVILGALGGKRLEHTLGNLAIAAGYAEKGYSVTLTDGNYCAKALYNGEMTFDEDNSGFISVFCTSGKAKGVTIIGLKYCLENAELNSSCPTLGVSNEFIGKRANISVKDGTLIIIWQKSKK